jgi:hypothetical protein
MYKGSKSRGVYFPKTGSSEGGFCRLVLETKDGVRLEAPGGAVRGLLAASWLAFRGLVNCFSGHVVVDGSRKIGKGLQFAPYSRIAQKTSGCTVEELTLGRLITAVSQA